MVRWKSSCKHPNTDLEYPGTINISILLPQCHSYHVFAFVFDLNSKFNVTFMWHLHFAISMVLYIFNRIFSLFLSSSFFFSARWITSCMNGATQMKFPLSNTVCELAVGQKPIYIHKKKKTAAIKHQEQICKDSLIIFLNRKLGHRWPHTC